MVPRRLITIACILIGFLIGGVLGVVWERRVLTDTDESRKLDHANGESHEASKSPDDSQERALISALIRSLQTQSFLENQPLSAAIAIDLLGELRATEAIPVLVNLLSFTPPKANPKTFVGPRGEVVVVPATVSLSQSFKRMPALTSLAKMGRAAIDAAIDVLRKDEPQADAVARFRLVWLIKAVEGEGGKLILTRRLEEAHLTRNKIDQLAEEYERAVLPKCLRSENLSSSSKF